jgi:hypothetical protein
VTRLVRGYVLFWLVLLIAPVAGAQEQLARFRITSVGDTTLAFSTGTSKWIKRGVQGTAVDPRRRDTLVARFQVIGVNEGLATAVITGQTTAVSTEHIVLLLPPRESWIRSRTFWLGLLLGTAVGVGAGAAISP